MKRKLQLESIETGATVANDGTGNAISSTSANFLVMLEDDIRKWCIQVSAIISISGSAYIDVYSTDNSFNASPFTHEEVWKVLSSGMSQELES